MHGTTLRNNNKGLNLWISGTKVCHVPLINKYVVFDWQPQRYEYKNVCCLPSAWKIHTLEEAINRFTDRLTAVYIFHTTVNFR